MQTYLFNTNSPSSGKVIGRALSQVADVLDVGTGRVQTAADDGVAACFRVVGAVGKSADGVVGAQLGCCEMSKRRCESDDRGQIARDVNNQANQAELALYSRWLALIG
jgi:hypothetical protein